jgi:hypothetical protein
MSHPHDNKKEKEADVKDGATDGHDSVKYSRNKETDVKGNQ